MYIYKKKESQRSHHVFFVNIDYERVVRKPIRKDSLPPSVTESVCVIKMVPTQGVGYILQGGKRNNREPVIKNIYL